MNKKMDKYEKIKVTDKKWLTPFELELEFGIKEQTQKEKRRNNELPYHKFGRFIYYKREDIDALFEDHKVV